MTDVIAIDPANPDPALLDRAGAVIRAGQLVAFPTETVYGVGANALDAEAVARIYQAKRRASDDPIIVHIAALDQLDSVALEPPEVAYELAAHFWPGPLTLVLRRAPAIPLNITAGMETVAVRMPAHPVAHGIIVAAGVPVGAPSANLFTRPSATRAADVIADLCGRVALILDGGPATHGIESTVLDLTGQPRILRPGALTLELLRTVLPDLPDPITVQQKEGSESGYRAPGTMLKHYSPRARMIVLDGPTPRRVLAEMAAIIREEALAGNRVGVVADVEDLAHLQGALLSADAVTMSLGPKNDLAAQGRLLFAALRDLDQAGVNVIVAAMPPPTGMGLALRDRLRRAASGEIREVPDR
jgi:L-threonylcarbamoyladenylate synthase